MDLQPGDIFLTRNPMALGKAINWIQRIKSNDNESIYSHAGIITTDSGMTLEALWTIKSQNLFDAYEGSRVMIGRNTRMTKDRYIKGIKTVRPFTGRRYPFHRLFLHLIPGASKYINTGRFLVCSELVDKFLFEAGIEKQYRGRNPDNIADMIRDWKKWETVFEGDI